MRDPERLDLSGLDPARNAKRWEALLQRTVDASLPVASPSLWPELARLKWGVLGLAAVAVLAWLPALVAEEPAGASTSSQVRPAEALLQVHQGGDVMALLESADVR